MADILEVKNISMNYHDPEFETMALRNVSFTVGEGEFVSIVGPSGCGKSTLLSIICNLIKPSAGEILINGSNIEDENIAMGYMLQKDHLLPWRTIMNNALLGLEIKNKLTDETFFFTETLLKKYGLYEFKAHYPRQLSGGMRQRVALIRTLAVNPEILLLDEPFSALDYQTRLTVSDEIASIIRSENKTAVLVTHDISEALSMSDRVIVLTARPATVLNVHTIALSGEGSPMKAREAPEFRLYFNKIWKELGANE